MAYKQKPSPFRQVAAKAAKAAARKKSGSSYDNFIDSTASYLKGEQGLIPDSITGGKPTRKAIGDGIRKVANSIDPKVKSPQSQDPAVKAPKKKTLKQSPSVQRIKAKPKGLKAKGTKLKQVKTPLKPRGIKLLGITESPQAPPRKYIKR